MIRLWTAGILWLAALAIPWVAVADSSMKTTILAASGEEGATPASILRRIGPLTPTMVAELRVAIADPDPYVRRTAIEMISLSGDSPLHELLRSLGDEDLGVREAAEAALVSAGPPAVPILADFSQRQSCLAPAKAAVARILARIGRPEVIPTLVSDLEACREAGPYLDVAFKSLAAIGAPAILPLIDAMRFQSLRGRSYRTLLQYESGVLHRSLTATIANPDRDLKDRLRYAEAANYLLGTQAVVAEINALAISVLMDLNQPAHLVATVDLFLKELPTFQPLTLAEVEAKYGDEALAKEYEREAREAAKKKQADLDKRRLARAAEELTSAQPKKDAVQPRKDARRRIPDLSPMQERWGREDALVNRSRACHDWFEYNTSRCEAKYGFEARSPDCKEDFFPAGRCYEARKALSDCICVECPY